MVFQYKDATGVEVLQRFMQQLQPDWGKRGFVAKGDPVISAGDERGWRKARVHMLSVVCDLNSIGPTKHEPE